MGHDRPRPDDYMWADGKTVGPSNHFRVTMPLSPPQPRSTLHHRHVHCQGFQREDGLWDIEGHMTDIKTYSFPNEDRGEIKAGEPLHEMWIRLTIDDTLTIKAVEAATDHAPFSMCDAITPAFTELTGLRIGGGFMREVRARLGGVKGCAHLVELLGPVATTAFQTMYPVLAKKRAAAANPSRPSVLEQCHAWATDSPVVKREFPDYYTGK